MNGRSSRSITALTRRLAAPVFVLALAAGAAVAAPAANAGVTPGCSWQPLNPINGWVSANSVFKTSDPAYCVDNGFVYLSGTIRDPSPNYTWFGVIPSDGRPAKDMYFPAYTWAGSTGAVAVEANGDLFAYGGKANTFTSLSGISFPAAGTALQPLPIDPDWQSADSQYRTGDPSYVISNGIIHLSGAVTASNSNPSAIDWSTPAVIRSDRCIATTAYTYDGQNGAFFVNPQFDVEVDDNGPAGYAALFTSLAGISYPVAGTQWQTLNLQSPWGVGPEENGCAIGAPAAYNSQGIVYLTGAVTQNNSLGPIGVLPQQDWPTHDLYLPVNDSYGSPASLHITPNGQVFVFGGVAQAFYVSLAGVAYPASS